MQVIRRHRTLKVLHPELTSLAHLKFSLKVQRSAADRSKQSGNLDRTN